MKGGSVSTLSIVFVCILGSLPCLVDSYVRSAHEGRFPYVWDTSSKKSVVWSRGSLLQRILGSSGVRMTDNRIRFISAGWSLIPYMRDDLPFARCKPCEDALCQVEDSELNQAIGVGVGSKKNPIAGTPIIVHGNTTHVCKNGVGRDSLASDTGGTRYDISVCDVVDGPIDVLFTHDRVYLAHVNVDTTLYVVTGLVVVVIIVLITQNLAVDILTLHGSEDSAIPTWLCVFLSLALSICSCLLPGVVNGGDPGFFVPISTLLDLYFFTLIVVYMTIHFFLWFLGVAYTNLQSILKMITVFRRTPLLPAMKSTSVALVTPASVRTGQLHSVNLMVCSLLLAIFSTHGTVETVLTCPLLFVFMFRTIFKSYAVENSFVDRGVSDSYTQVVFEPLLIALDVTVIGTIHMVGMVALAETTLHAHTLFVIMFFIAHTLAYESNRTRRKSTLGPGQAVAVL